ncbi:hypothetical protein [Lactococcus lactis]|uniref:hypothetical protein n=1 Tax=Lactococcus lactis TaxID=1358 RepID=UPI0018977703|nr:hypothetical protein [Lactococcus lactis]
MKFFIAASEIFLSLKLTDIVLSRAPPVMEISKKKNLGVEMVIVASGSGESWFKLTLAFDQLPAIASS